MRKFLQNHQYDILLVLLLLLNVLPFIAPLAMHWGWEWLAKPIYFLYSFTCHQFAHRSLHVHDHQCAWCSRDVAIWGALLFVAIMVRITGKERGIKWYWVIPFTIPIALDGGGQTLATVLGINPYLSNMAGNPIYISNNFLRTVTGALFGAGVGLWIFPSLWEGLKPQAAEVVKTGLAKWRHWRWVSMVGTASLIYYLVLMVIWSVSSPAYQPENSLDLAVKTPQNQEFFLRREHGICPADPLNGDTLAFDCFWR